MSTASPQLQDSQSGFMSMSIGTCNLQHEPDFARVWGVRLSEDQKLLYVVLPKVVGERTMNNLAVNKEISVNVADVTTFVTQQFKGVAIEIREATPDEISFARQSRDKTVPVLSQFFGDLATNWGRFVVSPSWTIVVGVREVYNQTPGKMAGMKIL